MSIGVWWIVPILTFYAGLIVGFGLHWLLVDFKRRDG